MEIMIMWFALLLFFVAMVGACAFSCWKLAVRTDSSRALTFFGLLGPMGFILVLMYLLAVLDKPWAEITNEKSDD